MSSAVQLEAQLERALEQLRTYERLTASLVSLVKVLVEREKRNDPPRSIHPAEIDPLLEGGRGVGSSLSSEKDSVSTTTEQGITGSIHPAEIDPLPTSLRRNDARRLHRAGWRCEGRRWISPDGQVVSTRREAVQALSGRQLHLPVLVVASTPPPRPGLSQEDTMPPIARADAVTDVRELVPLWDGNLAGLRPRWNPHLNSQLQAKLERVARTDGRFRTWQEWSRILWRCRSSPFLMGKEAMSDGRLLQFQPALLLNDGAHRGLATFATRVESGQYDPQPRIRRVPQAWHREAVPEHLDAQGHAWGPHRCLVGCCAPGCPLEALTGFRSEDGLFLPEGALCLLHHDAVAAWGGGEPHETSAQLAQLVLRWHAAGAPLADAVASADPSTCVACGKAGDGASFDSVRLGYECGCAGAWREELNRGRHFSEVAAWAAAQLERAA